MGSREKVVRLVFLIICTTLGASMWLGALLYVIKNDYFLVNLFYLISLGFGVLIAKFVVYIKMKLREKKRGVYL